MKIDHAAAQQAYASAAYRSAVDPSRLTGGTAAGPDAPLSTTATNDSVQISSQSRLRAQALDAVRSAPDGRAKLVDELRSQIKAGTYSVDHQNLATQLAKHIDVKA